MSTATLVEEVIEEAIPHELHRTLSAGLDRCEARFNHHIHGGPCGAQAFHLVIVNTAEGKPVDLVYCNSHYERFEEKLSKVMVYHSDQREGVLNEKASSSAPD